MNKFNNKCSVEKSDQLGRYVVSVQDIDEGETILTEKPILIFPVFGDETQRCCQCFKETGDICKSCAKFPICASCGPHNDFECQILQKLEKMPRKLNNVFGVIRCLVEMENDEFSEVFNTMEAHQSERRGTAIWKIHHNTTVDPLLGTNIKSLIKNAEVDSDLLQRICGVFVVNSFDIKVPDGVGCLRSLFPNAALLAHDCVANTIVSIDDNFQMKIYANRDIKSGELVTYCYTNPLWGTSKRRESLLVGKYFHCMCKRCEDSSELGSHMSSILCPSCPDGSLIQRNSNWRCVECNTIEDPSEIEELVTDAELSLTESEGNLRLLETTLRRYSKVLHKNHHVLVELKQDISAILRNLINDPTFNPNVELLQRKAQLCGEILDVLKIVQPGISVMKGIALYEFALPTSDIGRMNFDSGKITKDELKRILEKTQKDLKEAARMLSYEPLDSSEGQLARNIAMDLKELQEEIKDIRSW
ncbi:hypothetical protein ACFFRR_008536 [Megaselia abdita]